MNWNNFFALVKQKETKIANNDSSLESIENKINEVISGFKRCIQASRKV